MDEQSELFTKKYYQNLETAIEKLPLEVRSELYRPCAEACTQEFVLPFQRKLFEESNGNLDTFFMKAGESEFFFADVLEPGHIYEMGYPVQNCLCPMVSSGMSNSSVHCECSRQSILYVLKTLMPNKEITIEMIHSVLKDAKECRFRVTVK